MSHLGSSDARFAASSMTALSPPTPRMVGLFRLGRGAPAPTDADMAAYGFGRDPCAGEDAMVDESDESKNGFSRGCISGEGLGAPDDAFELSLSGL